MGPVALGMSLAFVNVVICAVGIDAYEPDAVGAYVMVHGFVPGLATGAVLAAHASAHGEWPVWLRRLTIVVPALLVVAALGLAYKAGRYILPASVPTLAAALFLERRTRAVPADPIARATSNYDGVGSRAFACRSSTRTSHV